MIDDYQPSRRARVFISCGQTKESDEQETAFRIHDALYEVGFDPYVAVAQQSLSSLADNIFARLRDYEYFVFVDFKRERLVPHGQFDSVQATDLLHRGSLFSHQELAIAAYLGLPLLAFQEKGVKTEDGILRSLQANPTTFTNRNELPELIAKEAQRRWNANSRKELILERHDPKQYDPHRTLVDGAVDSCRFYWIYVRNLHDHRIATNCYVYLEKITRLNPPTDFSFNSVELKWAGYSLPNAHIVRENARPFDAFFICESQPTELRLNNFSTSMSFGRPAVHVAGEYELQYAVVSDSFPRARASFTLTLSAKPDDNRLVLKELTPSIKHTESA